MYEIKIKNKTLKFRSEQQLQGHIDVLKHFGENFSVKYPDGYNAHYEPTQALAVGLLEDEVK